MFFFGEHKLVLFMSETQRNVCIGRHGGYVGPGTVCACVLLFLHFGCFCVISEPLVIAP